ncbi:c-type cytochrome [Sphingomonas natans]|nr:cytochrome c [Sphingomonas sp. BIUV-7]
MREHLIAGGLVLLAGAASALARDPAAETPRLGRPAAPEIVSRLDLTVASDGTGLPPGSGSVVEGRATYTAHCVACHGAAGSGGVADRLTGGIDTLASAKPVKTVASYWPYAPTLFDYIRRAMPLTAPQSLDDRQVYGLVAYLLSIDGIVSADARLDATNLPKIAMPNRSGFVSLEGERFDGNLERGKTPH